MLRKQMKVIILIGIDGWEGIKTTYQASAIHVIHIIWISFAIKIVSENIQSVLYIHTKHFGNDAFW